MKAVVFADRRGDELEPLTDNTCVALLPVAAKPLLAHTLDALAGIGVREAFLIVAPFADQIKQTLGGGSRWDMRLHYVTTQGEEPPPAVLKRLGRLPGAEFLALRGDVLYSRVLRQFLERASTLPGATVQALIAGGPVPLCLCRQETQDLQSLAWPPPPPASASAAVTLDPAVFSRLESLAAYHRANLQAAAGGFPGLILPGRPLALGLTVGPQSQVSPKSLKQGVALVGAGCRIHPEAEILGGAVIGNGVTVERYATLRACVVLPDSHIGELVELHHAIVRGNVMIRADTGAVLPLVETFLPADLKPATLPGAQAAALHRLLGLMLLLLSLPLWPVALLAALINDPRRPLRSLRLRGNPPFNPSVSGTPGYQEFTAWEWATPIPLLRCLPRLLAVVAGHLRLVGATPLTPEQAAGRRQSWERLGDEAPAGLIGPTWLDLPEDAAEETRRLSDAFYARQRTTGKDLRYLLRGLGALFSRRAWRPDCPSR